MAGASLLTLLDDIATILDDVAAMSKVAARKTAGVLGDDLALNAQQVSGVASERELPVVYAVAKGSFRNKLILVPLALLISAFIPWAITPLLMFGGLFYIQLRTLLVIVRLALDIILIDLFRLQCILKFRFTQSNVDRCGAFLSSRRNK